MTAKAAVAVGERGLVGVHQHIELDALLRIERGEFQNVAVPHESDRDIVIEVDRARRAGADPFGLRAGFRKHQRLGIGIDAELLQHGRKISPAVGGDIQFGLAAFHALLETSHGIVHRPLAVLNRGIIERDVERVFQLLCEGPGNAEQGRCERKTRIDDACFQYNGTAAARRRSSQRSCGLIAGEALVVLDFAIQAML